jgi:hypothetical protein
LELIRNANSIFFLKREIAITLLSWVNQLFVIRLFCSPENIFWNMRWKMWRKNCFEELRRRRWRALFCKLKVKTNENRKEKMKRSVVKMKLTIFVTFCYWVVYQSLNLVLFFFKKEVNFIDWHFIDWDWCFN